MLGSGHCFVFYLTFTFLSTDHGKRRDQQHYQNRRPPVQEELRRPGVTEEPAIRQDHDHDGSGDPPQGLFGMVNIHSVGSTNISPLSQDQDGSHIKGLLINFFHHNWPSLLKHTFLEEFITPIVKVRERRTHTYCTSFSQYT